MAKYRKKPVVIDAIRFTLNYQEVFDWVDQWPPEDNGPGIWEGRKNSGSLIISTLEGQMRADNGDWIIRGVKGEFYPIKNEIFKETYEIVEDNA